MLSDGASCAEDGAHPLTGSDPTNGSGGGGGRGGGGGGGGAGGGGGGGGGGSNKNRRRRTAFSTHQLMELEKEFQVSYKYKLINSFNIH